ncbi:MAG: TIR domain-containing protein, partial [Acidobacteria bacterium]
LRHLGVFERHHLLDVWQDGKIRVSSYWDDDITQAMSSARVAVVLLTPEALESQYILEKEFPFLRQRQQGDNLPVFPVICEPCDWKVHDWLRATQAPNESNPISPLTEARQDHIFRQLATDIATELNRVALAELPKSDQPPASDHIYLEKFPLTRGPGLREEKLIGREQELALLDLAFAQPQTAIVSLVAWGGVGKTMLGQHWLQRLQREGWFGAQRVYAWSFYSQGTKEDRQASEDTFLAHALAWFGVQCEPTLSPWDKGRLLADAVARERTLLILDGIEPLQYPPGPMGGQLRAPGVNSLLKHLARKAGNLSPSPAPAGEGWGEGTNGCLCLATTREPLTDLADFQRREGSPWGSVLRVDLGNLTDEAGAALLHHAGANRAGAAEIKPDDKELLAASREVDGHALTLNLLGRFVARAHGGDIRRRDFVKFEEADRKEQGGTTFKMLAAFENWFANEGEIEARALTILRLLGLFDRPADQGCMAALRRPPVIEGMTEPLFALRRNPSADQITEQPVSDKAWNDATHFLADFGLVLVHADAKGHEHLLDCHPLIREHFAIELRENHGEASRTGHRRIYQHLTDSVDYQPNTLEEIQPLYHAVRHGCLAGLDPDVLLNVHRARIRHGNVEFTIYRLGAFTSELAALACYFEHRWNVVKPNLPDSYAGWILSEVAFCLRAGGRLQEAIGPATASLKTATSSRMWDGAARRSSNLGEICMTLGEIQDALTHFEYSVQWADLSGHTGMRVVCRAFLADALHNAGDLSAAAKQFADSEHAQVETQPSLPYLYSYQGFIYCDFLLGSVERTLSKLMVDEHNASAAASVQSQRISEIDAALNRCCEVCEKAERSLKLYRDQGITRTADIMLDRLTVGRSLMFVINLSRMRQSTFRRLSDESGGNLGEIERWADVQLNAPVERFRAHAEESFLVVSLLSRAWLRCMRCDSGNAQADLDEAWDIAERGPMRLHMADIHLYRARLFFREKPYPWKSPQDDLAAAEKLINECGYHRRDEELADAKHAILGS